MLKKILDKQYVISLALALLISYFPILSFINVVTNIFLPSGFIYDTLLFYILLTILLGYAIILIIPKIKVDVILLFSFILISYLLTYLLHERNRIFMFTSILDLLNNPLYVLVFFSFPAFLFARHIEDFKLFFSIFKNVSIIVIICSLLILIEGINSETLPQYMVFSYNMLPQTLCLLIYSLREKKKFHFVISILGFFLIFVAGARGPIVIALLVLFIYSMTNKSPTINKILFLTLLIFVLVTTLLLRNSIIYLLDEFSTSLNFSSRTLKLILSGEFFNSSGRDDILVSVVDKFSLFGNGLYGDRDINYSYSHNLFIEILSDFGVIIGLILIAIIITISYKAVFSNNEYIYLLSIVFIATGFIKLFLSGSYLNQEPAFFLFIALGINSIKERYKINENSLDHKYYFTNYI